MDELNIQSMKHIIGPSLARSATRRIPKPEGVMKLNVERAVAKPENKGAIGVVWRDEHEEFKEASMVMFDGVTEGANP